MTDNAETSPTPAPEAHNTIYVIGARAAALLSLAALAPGLSEAELRTALYLASIEDPIHHSAVASSRQIAAATRLERKNVIRALDSLGTRCLITTRQGYGRRPSSYLLNFTQTASFSSGVTVTPLAAQSGVTATPLLPLFSNEVVSQRHHPSEPQAPVDISIPTRSDSILDRILNAKPAHYDKPTLAELRQWVWKFMTQFGPDPHVHQPDDRLLAQMLAIAPLQQLVRLCNTLFQEGKKPEFSYGWFVAVALQRIHGIQPDALQARRADLREVKRPKSPKPPEPTQDNLGFTENLIADLAKAKGM